jgi:pilus assembly protein Flp/PilA
VAKANELLRDESGAELVEWGLLVALIAVVALVAVAAFGSELSDLLDRIVDALTG